MPIKLNNLENVATIIKTKYGDSLHDMNFIFCIKKNTNSYFIFQEIQGMPIKRVVYHESNNSITFVASWASWSNPFAMVADANYESIESWKDLQDRSRPYNSYINIKGGFNNSDWKSIDRQNRTESQKKHKNKSDNFLEFRIDKIQRANFNRWGFELYSNTISIIGFNSQHNFPYVVQNVKPEHDYADLVIPDTSSINYEDEDEDEETNVYVKWQGGHFSVPAFEKQEEISVISSHSQNLLHDLSSYWDINESDKDNELFDEEMTNIFMDNSTNDNTILDIGQRKVDLDFND